MEEKGLFTNGDRVYRTDQNQENGDNFGLPETGSSSSGGAAPKPTPGRYNPEPDPEYRSSGLTIIFIILFLLAGVFLVYWFVIRKPHPKEKIVAQDTTAVQAPKDSLASLESVKKDTVPLQPAVGEISTINEKTGRYYVVISSSVDSDLANDYATKLSHKGVNCKIIPPVTVKKGFYKLSVADFGTLNEAKSKVEELKGTYGNEIRVLKF